MPYLSFGVNVDWPRRVRQTWRIVTCITGGGHNYEHLGERKEEPTGSGILAFMLTYTQQVHRCKTCGHYRETHREYVRSKLIQGNTVEIPRMNAGGSDE